MRSSRILFVALTLALAGVNASIIPRDDISSPGILGFLLPPARGWDYTTATTSPCGGFTTANYSSFGLGGAPLYIQAENEVSDVVLGYSSSSDISSLITISEFSTITTGNFCLADSIDWDAAGFGFGDKITLQLSYHDDITGVDMFQCSDIEFTSEHAYEPSITVTCSNTSSLTTSSGTTTSSSSSAATVTVTVKAGSSGLSALQAGWTGACVTLAVIGIMLGAASFFGVIFFKKPARGQAIHLNQRGAHQLDDDISLQQRPVSSIGDVKHPLGH